MLVVDKPYRKLKLGSELVSRALEIMQAEGADECVLEVESTNQVSIDSGQSSPATSQHTAVCPRVTSFDDEHLLSLLLSSPVLLHPQGALRLYQNLGFIRDKRLAK